MRPSDLGLCRAHKCLNFACYSITWLKWTRSWWFLGQRSRSRPCLDHFQISIKSRPNLGKLDRISTKSSQFRPNLNQIFTNSPKRWPFLYKLPLFLEPIPTKPQLFLIEIHNKFRLNLDRIMTIFWKILLIFRRFYYILWAFGWKMRRNQSEKHTSNFLNGFISRTYWL